jgi:hypothetical protein
MILRTSSGKPRRKRMWMALRSGELAGTIIHEPGTVTATTHLESMEAAR